MPKFVQPRLLGEICKYDWSTIDKAAGRDRPAGRVLDRRMCGASCDSHLTLGLFFGSFRRFLAFGQCWPEEHPQRGRTYRT